MLESACTPPRPDGSVGRGVFLGMVLDLFQIALLPSIVIICELVYPPSQQARLACVHALFLCLEPYAVSLLGPGSLDSISSRAAQNGPRIFVGRGFRRSAKRDLARSGVPSNKLNSQEPPLQPVCFLGR
jgi:hypothetical protein